MGVGIVGAGCGLIHEHDDGVDHLLSDDNVVETYVGATAGHRGAEPDDDLVVERHGWCRVGEPDSAPQLGEGLGIGCEPGPVGNSYSRCIGQETPVLAALRSGPGRRLVSRIANADTDR